MRHCTPAAFFQDIQAEKGRFCTWVGELYLELHRGTYTTHARTKVGCSEKADGGGCA